MASTASNDGPTSREPVGGVPGSGWSPNSKTTLKRALILLTGGFTRSNPDEFRTSLDQLLTALEGISPVVVCIGLFDVDQHVFPKQHTLNVPFRTQRYRVLAEHPRVIPAEIDEHLHHWDDFLGDHGHWNASGHATVAGQVLLALRSQWPELAVPVARHHQVGTV